MANKPKAYDWKGFTDKERLFCYEYIIDKNKTKAAVALVTVSVLLEKSAGKYPRSQKLRTVSKR